MSEPKAHNSMIKLGLEMGPLLLFFLANSQPHLFKPLLAPWLPAGLFEGEKAGIFTATILLMIGVLVTLVISQRLTGRWPIMPLVTAIAVLFFGALTLAFQNDVFIKMKPTIVNLIFGAALLGGLYFGKLLLPLALDSVMHLTAQGWRILTLRWGLFFFALAGLNELVWRTQTTDVWAKFKVFGIVPLTMVFALAQVPLILRYETKPEAGSRPAPSPDDAT
jgi:intracellular septation protein